MSAIDWASDAVDLADLGVFLMAQERRGRTNTRELDMRPETTVTTSFLAAVVAPPDLRECTPKLPLGATEPNILRMHSLALE